MLSTFLDRGKERQRGRGKFFSISHSFPSDYNFTVRIKRTGKFSFVSCISCSGLDIVYCFVNICIVTLFLLQSKSLQPPNEDQELAKIKIIIVMKYQQKLQFCVDFETDRQQTR